MRSSYGLDAATASDATAVTLCRYADSEPHTTAALIGGIAAQEALKLLTRQFMPLDNTVAYCGVRCAVAAFRV